MCTRFHRRVSLVFLVSACVLSAHPAYANVPLAWAIIGNNASLYAGIVTKGVGVVVVVLIEFLTFWRYMHLSWRKALTVALALNLISTAVGVVIAIPSTLLPLLVEIVLVPSAVVILSRKIRAPRGFTALAFFTVVIGTIGALLNWAILIPPQPPIRIGVALLLPLCLGFGVTIMIEAAAATQLKPQRGAATRVLEEVTIWKGVLVANACSYLFLVVMLPFVFPTPYDGGLTQMKLRRLMANVEDGREEGDIVRVLHHLRASNLFLLGLSENDAPSRQPYDPSIERWLMEEFRESKPALVQAIENDLDTLQHVESP